MYIHMCVYICCSFALAHFFYISNLPPQEAQLCPYQRHFFIEFLTCVVWRYHPVPAFTHCFIVLTEDLLNCVAHDEAPMIFSDLKAQCM